MADGPFVSEATIGSQGGAPQTSVAFALLETLPKFSLRSPVTRRCFMCREDSR